MDYKPRMRSRGFVSYMPHSSPWLLSHLKDSTTVNAAITAFYTLKLPQRRSAIDSDFVIARTDRAVYDLCRAEAEA
jgi:hypothetical protein